MRREKRKALKESREQRYAELQRETEARIILVGDRNAKMVTAEDSSYSPHEKSTEIRDSSESLRTFEESGKEGSSDRKGGEK